MTALRVAMITAKFWPRVGGSASAWTRLAVALAERGVDCRIVTPRWSREWPTELVYDGLPVVRLSHPGRGRWGGLRYMLGLSRWLRARRGSLDVVCVDGLRYDAHATLGALRHAGIPVAIRARGLREEGDVAWQDRAALGGRVRRRCLAAHALIAPNAWARRELIDAGFADARIHVIQDGVAVGAERGDQRRATARATMSDANFDLTAPLHCPVALHASALEKNRGLFDLVDAWAHVVRRFPDARLWLVGDGSLREAIHGRINDRELRANVFLPGTFDEIDELFHAADLFVTASHRPGPSMALMEAMAHGLPCVATDTPGHRLLITDDVHGLLAEVGQPQSLARAIIRVFSAPGPSRLYGDRGRQRVADEYAIERSARAHLDLFLKLQREARCDANPSS